MKELSNIDYIYVAVGIIFGLVLLFSPRTFMRKAKYDEEALKAESLFKKVGIGIIIISIVFGIFIFIK